MEWMLAILRENWAVIEQAPLAAILLIALGFAIGVAFVRNSNKSLVETLNERIKHRDDRLLECQNKLDEAIKSGGSRAMGPDDISQSGRVVGKAVGVRVQRNKGSAYIEDLQANGDFNPRLPFEYRDDRLQILQSGSSGESIIAGAISQKFAYVTCAIVK